MLYCTNPDMDTSAVEVDHVHDMDKDLLGLDFAFDGKLELDFDLGSALASLSTDTGAPSPPEPTPPLSRSGSDPSISSTSTSTSSSASASASVSASNSTTSSSSETTPLKSVLLSPSAPSPISPSTNVTFSLPPPGRLPRIADEQGPSRRRRRVQVGAFGEISWVEAPQPASSPSVRSRRAGPAPQASDKDNNDKDWLIAYHVEQMTHDAKKHKQVRDKERAKRNERNVIHNSSLNEHRRQRGLPPSPLSRSDGDSQTTATSTSTSSSNSSNLESISEERRAAPRPATKASGTRPQIRNVVLHTSPERNFTPSRLAPPPPTCAPTSATLPSSPLAAPPLTARPGTPSSLRERQERQGDMSRRPSLFNLTLAAFSRKPSTKSKSPLALSRSHGRTGSQSSTSGSSRASQDSSLQSEVSESTSTSASTEESVASDKPALPALALSSPVSLASDLPSTPRSGTPESDVLVTPVGAAVVRAWPAAKAAGAGVDADHVENHQTI